MTKIHGTSLMPKLGLDTEIADNYRGSFLRSLGISSQAVEGRNVTKNGFRENPKRNESIFRAVAASAVYELAVNAYREGNQSRLSRLIPRIFRVSVDDDYSQNGELYHGVYADISEQTPGAYIDAVLGIQKDGLRASPVGVHHDMDDILRPLYTVTHVGETHGLLFFGLEPWQYGYVVFNPSYEAERLIYSPTVDASLKLYLKSSKFLDEGDPADSDNIEGTGLATLSETRAFRDELERRLKQRGIEFELVDPGEPFRETGFMVALLQAALKLDAE